VTARGTNRVTRPRRRGVAAPSALHSSAPCKREHGCDRAGGRNPALSERASHGAGPLRRIPLPRQIRSRRVVGGRGPLGLTRQCWCKPRRDCLACLQMPDLELALPSTGRIGPLRCEACALVAMGGHAPVPGSALHSCWRGSARGCSYCPRGRETCAGGLCAMEPDGAALMVAASVSAGVGVRCRSACGTVGGGPDRRTWSMGFIARSRGWSGGRGQTRWRRPRRGRQQRPMRWRVGRCRRRAPLWSRWRRGPGWRFRWRCRAGRWC
jgi:hypothetical protein